MNTTQRTGTSRTDGFTLVELLIGLVIGLVLIGAMYQFFIRQRRSYSSQDEILRAQQSAVTASDVLNQAIQQAGAYSPTTGHDLSMRGAVVLAASDHYLTIQYDDPNRTSDLGVITADEVVTFACSKPTGSATEYADDGDATTPANIVRVWWDQNGDGTVAASESADLSIPMVLTGPPYTLYRVTPNAANPAGAPKFEALVDQVDNLVFTYYDGEGNQIPRQANGTPQNPPYILTAQQRAEIRAISVKMATRSRTSDSTYHVIVSPPDYTIATRDTSGAPRAHFSFPDDGYRRYEVTTRVTPRNLSASSCGDLTLTATPSTVACPASATVKAVIKDRYGKPVSGASVRFTASQEADLSPSSQVTNANGEASTVVTYTGKSQTIPVSANAIVDCDAGGVTKKITLQNAIPVAFGPGAAVSVALSGAAHDHAHSAAPGYAALNTGDDPSYTFKGTVLDACGNAVPPPTGAPITFSTVDGNGFAFGSLNSTVLDVPEKTFTVTAPSGPTGTAGYNGIARDLYSGHMWQRVKVNPLPAWATGGLLATDGPDPNNSDLNYVYNLPAGNIYPYSMELKPWPPAKLVDPMNPTVPVQDDCSSADAVFYFQPQDKYANAMPDGIDVTSGYSVVPSFVSSNCSSMTPASTLGALLWTPTAVPASLFTDDNSYLYRAAACRLDPACATPSYPLGSGLRDSLKPTYQLSLLKGTTPIYTTAPGTMQLAPCGQSLDITVMTNPVTTPPTINRCVASATVSVSGCNLPVKTLDLDVLNLSGTAGNLSFSSSAAQPTTPAPIALAGSGAGPYTGTTTIYLGTAGNDSNFGFRGYYPTKVGEYWHTPATGTNPAVAVTASDRCRKIEVFRDNTYAPSSLIANDTPPAATLAPTSVSTLYFRVSDCQSNGSALTQAVDVCVASATGACYDEEKVTLSSATAIAPFNDFRSATSGIGPLPMTWSKTPTSGNGVLEYPPGKYAYLLIGYRDPNNPAYDSHWFSSVTMPALPPQAYPTVPPGQLSIPLVPTCSLTVSPTTAQISVGGTAALTVPTKPPGGATAWLSNDPSIATVDSSGVVTGVSPGTTTIEASDSVYGNFCGTPPSAVVAVSCVTHPNVVVSPGATLSFTLGSNPLTQQLSVTSGGLPLAIAWDATPNAAVATVSPTGLVTPTGPGNVNLTGTDFSGCVKVLVSVSVTCPTTSVSPASQTVTLGNTFSFGSSGAVLNPLAWSSSNLSVATVNSGGTVTGLTPGDSVISFVDARGCASSANGALHVSCPSRVLTPADFTLTGATTQSMTVSTAVAGATWQSSNAGVASINSAGTVTAVGTGTTTISYNEPSGCSTSTSATVSCGLATTTPGPYSLVRNGTTKQLDLSGSFGAVTWTSSSSSKATVSSTGLVKSGSSTGSVTITAKDSSNCSKTFSFNITN